MTQPDKQKQPTYENDNPHNEVKPENDKIYHRNRSSQASNRYPPYLRRCRPG